MMPGIMHPHTGAYLATAWEGTLLYPVGVEMAHAWGVPSLAGVFATDGQAPGWQSGGDAASSLMLCALTGAETGSGLGLLEFVHAALPGRDPARQRYLPARPPRGGRAGYRPEALALDVIKAVGPRGQFLRQRHTA